MKVDVLERSQVVPRPRGEVFGFFAEARNLEAITPAFLHFEILPPVPEIRPGALIDYRLSLFGLTFRWRTRIEVFEPEERFVDVQLRGPYRLWHHTHTFEDVRGATRVGDRVRYELPHHDLDQRESAIERQTLELHRTHMTTARGERKLEVARRRP